MGATRWTYNQCLDGIKNKSIKKNKKDLRAYCVNKTSDLICKNEWCNEIPYDIRDEGMNDLLKAFKTCFAKKEKFEIKFKSKKDEKNSIVIHFKHYKHKKRPYSMISKMKFFEKIPNFLNYDLRLIKDQLNQY